MNSYKLQITSDAVLNIFQFTKFNSIPIIWTFTTGSMEIEKF